MRDLNLLFSIAGDIVLPVWLLLIFVPRWRWTQRLATFVVPLVLTALYAYLFLHAGHVQGAGYSSLAQVERLFTSRDLLLAGWLHYLAFDLFTGAWEARDALRLDLPRWLVAPFLLLTFTLRSCRTLPVPAAQTRNAEGDGSTMMTLRSWLERNPALDWAFAFQLVLGLLALLAMPFDHRLILGINPWIKPMKFDISVGIMLVTLAGILSGLQRFERSRLWIGGVVGIALSLENCIISLQSLRGVPSHMNYSTPLNGRLFALMGILITVSTVLFAWTLGLVVLDPTCWPPAVAWGVRLGLLALLAGSLEGVGMVGHGGHTVGAPDGLRGLPFLNWSREHGDLRIAHFFALHALQAFPLLGWLLSRTSLQVKPQIALICVGAGLYLGAVWLLFHQALAGHALLGASKS